MSSVGFAHIRFARFGVDHAVSLMGMGTVSIRDTVHCVRRGMFCFGVFRKLDQELSQQSVF